MNPFNYKCKDEWMIEISDLIRRVSSECDYERGAICASDCLLQWKDGKLKDTIEAWRSYLEEKKNKTSYAMEFRHGAWVPAIPLK